MRQLTVLLAATLTIAGVVTGSVCSDEPTQAEREVLASLGEFLERDWKDRPEWAVMAASVLKGEPLGPGRGWFGPSGKRYSWQWLRERCDRDGDDQVSRDEFKGTDDRFRVLDRDGNGRVTGRDLDFDGRQSLDPSAAMAMELFYVLDKDSNGRISTAEMQGFFGAADQGKTGFLVEEDLVAALRPPARAAAPPENAKPEFRPGANPLADLRMLLSGELGSLSDGPKLNDAAPDFLLRRHDSDQLVSLQQFQGERPVVLVFGSFT